MDTQGMSAPSKGNVSEVQNYPPYIPTKLTAFTDIERKELKELIHEVLDERECKNEDDSWLYRGTY
tara:strand:- start:207 stop:404 length:198 start_codon:yes stop_codon:yes gene_type:complete